MTRSSSTGSASLRRNPAAPDRRDSKTYSSSSKVVRTSTLTSRAPRRRDLPGGLEPVEDRHADVHDHDVRPLGANDGERRRTIARLGDDGRSSAASSNARRPARMRGWSSASTTRITAVPAATGGAQARGSRRPGGGRPRDGRRPAPPVRACRRCRDQGDRGTGGGTQAVVGDLDLDPPSARLSVTSTRDAPAWRITFASDSWTMRKAATSMAGGRSESPSPSRNSTGRPARPATRPGRDAIEARRRRKRGGPDAVGRMDRRFVAVLAEDVERRPQLCGRSLLVRLMACERRGGPARAGARSDGRRRRTAG